MVLMLSNFNLNITLLVQASLVNGSNEIQSIDKGYFTERSLFAG